MTDPPDPVAQQEFEALAARAAAGDEEALDPLLERIRPMVLDHCRRILRNAPDEAEDAAQDALVRVFQRISSFEGKSRFTTWLWPLTLHAALDALRRMKAETASIEGVDRPDPRTTSLIAGTRIDLVDALENINPIYAHAVVLRDVCDWGYPEIAALLDIPVTTARTRVKTGRDLVQPRMR